MSSHGLHKYTSQGGLMVSDQRYGDNVSTKQGWTYWRYRNEAIYPASTPGKPKDVDEGLHYQHVWDGFTTIALVNDRSVTIHT